jgi:hypothetical protein
MSDAAPPNREVVMPDQIKHEKQKFERLLRRFEAANYVTATYGIPCSAKTLAKLACISSDGPPFRLAGRFPLYPVSGLDVWAQKKIGPLVRSTSEARTAA